MHLRIPPSVHEIAAWVVMGLLLFLTLKLHLVPALIAGFLVYELVYGLAPRLHIGRLSGESAKAVVVGLISIMVILLIVLLIWGVSTYILDAESLATLFKKMAEILEGSQALLPNWTIQYMPRNAEELKASAVTWLNEHAGALPMAGKEASRIMAQVLIGLVMGSMISLIKAPHTDDLPPLSRALAIRLRLFHSSFRQIVFAQARISGLNTLFTWIYLMVALPLLGIQLPLAKTMVAITFITGLLPVVGNLISNTIIFIVSLSTSLAVAISSLVFLIVIHKLEYFLNARIIGSSIQARAWELLLAMLIMEAAFGLAGVIMAPIYYAYLKNELSTRGLI